MEQGTSLRERRRRRTRAEIVRVAMQLFRRGGYESTAVNDIAAGALISPRTFYRYFPTKEELVFQGFPYSVELLRREVSEGATIFERLQRGSITLASVLERHRGAWLERFDLIFSVPSLRARYAVENEGYELVFQQALRELWPEDDERIELLAGALMGGIVTAIRSWVRSGGRPPLPELTRRFFESLSPVFPGASPRPPGREAPRPPREPPPRKRPAPVRRSVELDFLD